MNIYIPSRGRWADKFLDGRSTPMCWLTDELAPRSFYVVRSDEFKRYAHALHGTGVGVLDCGLTQNLSEKRQWIAEHAQQNGEPTFMMCDDDVMLYVRKSAKGWQLRKPKEDEVDALFEQIEQLLNKYAMVGISAREGNNRAGIGPFPLIKECTRAMRMYAFSTDDYLSIDANRLSEMADFDTVLQLLRKGQKNAVINYWAQSHPTTQLDGGCSYYRTRVTHDKVARQLAALHPGLVKLVKKQGKHGLGERTEPDVSWKAAYADP